MSRIPHHQLADCWGHGFVWVNRLCPERIRYLAKYVAKGGSLPAFLYGEPPRSVKVIRTSPGFWGDSAPPRRDDDDPEPPPRVTAFRPIGESLRLANARSVVEHEGRFRSVSLSLDVLLGLMLRSGSRFVRRVGGWLELEGGAVPAEAGAAGRRAGLHSIKRQNPDGDGWPAWVRQLFAETLNPAGASGGAW